MRNILLILIFFLLIASLSSAAYYNAILISWDGTQKAHMEELLKQGDLPGIGSLGSDGSFIEVYIPPYVKVDGGSVEFPLTKGAVQDSDTIYWERAVTDSGHARMLSGKWGFETDVCRSGKEAGDSNDMGIDYTCANNYRTVKDGLTIFEKIKGAGNISVGVSSGRRADHREVLKNVTRGQIIFYGWDNDTIIQDFGEETKAIAGHGFFSTTFANALPDLDFFFDSYGADAKESDMRQRGYDSSGSFIAGGELKDSVVADQAIKFIEQANSNGSRFFLFVHFAEPDLFGHMYGEASEEYSRAIMSNDNATKKIMDKLKALDIYEDTLVIVTTDHGAKENSNPAGYEIKNGTKYQISEGQLHGQVDTGNHIVWAVSNQELNSSEILQPEITPLILQSLGIPGETVKMPSGWNISELKKAVSGNGGAKAAAKKGGGIPWLYIIAAIVLSMILIAFLLHQKASLPIIIGALMVLLLVILFIYPYASGSPSTETPTIPAESLDFKILANSSTTQKVCQLIGDADFQTGEPTLALTRKNYGIGGTDMGQSFEWGNRTYFLFGDTSTQASGIPAASDSIGYIDADQLVAGECFKLDFESEGGVFRPAHVDGGDVSHAGFEVPIGGFSYNGTMYVFFVANAKADRYDKNDPYDVTGYGRTVLAKRTKENSNFEYLYDFSIYDARSGEEYPDTKAGFIEATPVLVDSSDVPGLPKEGKGVLVYGSGAMMYSKVYLAYISMDDLERRKPSSTPGGYLPSEAYYFAGTDIYGNPIWKNDWENHDDNAEPLFEINDSEGNPAHHVSDVSVVFDNRTGYWYMLYTNGVPPLYEDSTIFPDSEVHFRYAEMSTPWDFSPLQKVFEAKEGYGKFIHEKGKNDGLVSGADQADRMQRSGNPYAAYMIPEKFSYNPATGKETIYFLLSTGNPYTSVLMKTELELKK